VSCSTATLPATWLRLVSFSLTHAASRIYPANYTEQISLQFMGFAEGVGRSYRYYKGHPLFAFGAGGSYTNFSLSCARTASGAATYSFNCTIGNSGPREGDEVLQVYHIVSTLIREKAPHPVPLKRLVEFERVRLSAGAQTHVGFSLHVEQFALIDNEGGRVVYSGDHDVIFSRGHGDDVVIPVSIAVADAGAHAPPAPLDPANPRARP
jgi:hypothetical protein